MLDNLAALIATLMLLSGVVAAEDGPCNNTGRVKDFNGGTHNSISHDCPQITLTVNVAMQQVQLMSVASCQSGGITYDGTVFKCSGAVGGVNCDPQGFKVNYTAYSPLPNCPKLPTALSFGSLQDAADYLYCQPPAVISSSYDWSAQARRCVGEPHTESVSMHETWVATPDGPALYWEDDLSDGVALVGDPSEFDPWMGTSSADPGPTHPELASLIAEFGPLGAVQIAARITSSEPGSGHVSEVSVEGVWVDDGRFECTVYYPGVDPEGRPVVLESLVAFDGAILTAMTAGAEDALAWVPGSTSARREFRRRAYWAPMVMSWMVNPLGIQQASASGWEPIAAPSGQHLVRRDFEGFVQQVHFDLEDDARPALITSASQGVLYKQLEFDGLIDLGDGTVRPEVTTRKMFAADPEPFTTKLAIRSAHPLGSVASDFGRVSPESGRWLILP